MIRRLLNERIKKLYPNIDFDVLIPPNSALGDYSTNIAFGLAKAKKENPKELAVKIYDEIAGDPEIKKIVSKVTNEGGFINLNLSKDFLIDNLTIILKEGNDYGSLPKNNRKINIEFVSANPTGPVTVHNVRAAPFGDTLGNVLTKAGYDVSKEYYINDVGIQVKKLGESFYKKFLKNFKGQEVEFGEDLYQGEYIDEYVKKIVDDLGEGVAEGLNEDGWQNEAVETFINSITASLKNLGINFNIWFYESDLHEMQEVRKTLELIKKSGQTFEKDDALWLKYDDKEAVLVKKDGITTTYLMNDIAYTKNKFERGFDLLVNIWGTDHHGDVSRLKAGAKAIGFDPDKLKVILHQLISIKSGGEVKRMSKRKGELVLLDELLVDVGADAIRFFLLMKDLNTHMEFDVDLAKEQSKKNPVFYIQYANARLNSIFEKVKTVEGAKIKTELNEEESALLRHLVKFKDLVVDISENYNVHHLAQYTVELASLFHKFYEIHRIIEDDKINSSRLDIVKGVEIILKECLSLMGISAPERM